MCSKAGMFKHVLSSEELHAKQGEDENKQEQKEQKWNNWTHAVEQRYHEIAKWRPISAVHTQCHHLVIIIVIKAYY